MNPWE